MSNKNYYEILGVDKTASDKDIKKAFKKLAVEYHPDKQQDKSEEEKKVAEDKFKEINEAYAILSDKDKRQQYDKFGTVDGNGMGFDDMEDIMNHMRNTGFGGFNPFGGFSNQQYRIRKGTDCKIKLHCTIEDLYNQVEKKIKYNRNITCPDCNGSGGTTNICTHCGGVGKIVEQYQQGNMLFQSESTCPHCHGTGHIVVNACKTCHGTGVVQKSELVHIPIQPQMIKMGYGIMQGMGNYPNQVEENCVVVPGNLIIVLDVAKDGEYRIADNGFDLVRDISVNVIDCILGCKYRFKLVSGKEVEIDIPSNTIHRNNIRIQKEGLIKPNGERGDLYLVVSQVMPTSLTEDEKNILTELSKTIKFEK